MNNLNIIDSSCSLKETHLDVLQSLGRAARNKKYDVFIMDYPDLLSEKITKSGIEKMEMFKKMLKQLDRKEKLKKIFGDELNINTNK